MMRSESWATKLFVITLALIPFYLPLSVWTASNFGSVYIFSAWKELVMALLLILFVLPVFGILRSREQSVKIMAWSMLAYIVLNLLYVFRADNFFEFTAGILFSTRFLFFFLLAYVFASRGWLKIEALVKLIIGTGIVLSVLAILQATVLPIDTLQHIGYEAIGVETPGFPPAVTTLGGDNDGLIRPQATLRGPNALGAFLVLPFALLFWKFLRARKFTLKNGWPLVIISVGILLTLSRSTWIAVAIVIAGALLHFHRDKLKRIPKRVLLLGGVLLVFLSVFAMNNQTFKLVIFREDPATSEREPDTIRLALNKEGWRDVVEHPLGRGPGNAGPVSVLDKNDAGRIAENYFLQVAQETGWLGLLLFLAINVFLGVRLWELRKNKYALITLVTLVGLSITCLTLHTWSDDAVSIIWWSFAGCIVGTPIINNVRRKTA